ncbi:MAG: PsiF family protein [Rhodocyclaceae bacterium]|jgi:hypothetical protein|nr:PsiF family protein [Rhodocyclaceae bacterium]
MKHRVLTAAGLLLALSIAPPLAHATTPQQERMKKCNADAKTQSLAGDARKAFMKDCLSNKGAEAAGAGTQQEKMKACNQEAKTQDLSGDKRKAFMKDCLSNKN